MGKAASVGFFMVTIPTAHVSAFGVQSRLPCEDANCAAGSTRFATRFATSGAIALHKTAE